MAIVKYPLGSDGENSSFQGATFTRNFSGSIIRARRKPLYKATPRTTAARTIFRNVVTNYRLMSPAQKSDWASKTIQFPRVDSLGIPYEMRSNQLFTSANQNRILGELPITQTAPDFPVFPSRSIFNSTLDVDPVDINVELDNNEVPADYQFNFWMSSVRMLQTSLSFPEDYKLIQTFDPAIYLNFDMSTAYQSNWGPGPSVQAGNPIDWYIYIVLEPMHIPSGTKSVAASDFATVLQ